VREDPRTLNLLRDISGRYSLWEDEMVEVGNLYREGCFRSGKKEQKKKAFLLGLLVHLSISGERLDLCVWRKEGGRKKGRKRIGERQWRRES